MSHSGSEKVSADSTKIGKLAFVNPYDKYFSFKIPGKHSEGSTTFCSSNFL